MHLTFLYVVGASFAAEEVGVGTGASSLLPFLPPRDSDETAFRDAALIASDGSGPDDQETARVRDGMSTEARSLLLSLSSAGIPCLTLSQGDYLIRALSIWSAGRKRAVSL